MQPDYSQFERRRRITLLSLLPLLSSICYIGWWSSADLPVSAEWHRHIWTVSGTLFLSLFLLSIKRPEFGRAISWAALVFMATVLVTRMAQLFTGPLLDDPNASMFVGLFAYIPLQYIFCYLLLPPRDDTIASISLWFLFACLSLFYAIPELENGREGARNVVILMTMGQPMVILLLASLPKYEAVVTSQQQQLYESEKSRKEYELQASTDSLTGLLNRRGFDDQLFDAWSDTQTNEKLCFLLLLDIDYFKHFNDSLGHPEGDRCLVTIAQNLARLATRQNLVAARVGGEEFALLGQVHSTELAQSVAEQANAIVHSLQLPHPKPEVAGTYVTASVGYALIKRGEGDIRSLIATADSALYDAKRSGRNRVKQQKIPAHTA